MSLGERLINLRKEKHLSQEELAEKLGVTRQTISKWETEESKPDFDKIIPLCMVLGISSDELLTGEKKVIEEPSKKENRKKAALGFSISIFLYFISIVWIILSEETFHLNDGITISGFLIICAIATCNIIYTAIAHQKEKEQKPVDKTQKQIEDILALITVIIYLSISFITMAWHQTWIIWIIYALLVEIIKLIRSLKGDKNEK